MPLCSSRLCLLIHTPFTQSDAQARHDLKDTRNIKSNSTTLYVACFDKTCPFILKWSSKHGQPGFLLKSVDLNHTCTGEKARKRQLDSGRLARVVPSLNVVTVIGKHEKGKQRFGDVQHLLEDVQQKDGVALRYGQGYSIIQHYGGHPQRQPLQQGL